MLSDRPLTIRSLYFELNNQCPWAYGSRKAGQVMPTPFLSVACSYPWPGTKKQAKPAQHKERRHSLTLSVLSLITVCTTDNRHPVKIKRITEM